jgi:hypothetical protein
LSASWLEFFSGTDDERRRAVVAAFASARSVKPRHGFAFGNIREVKMLVQITGLKSASSTNLIDRIPTRRIRLSEITEVMTSNCLSCWLVTLGQRWWRPSSIFDLAQALISIPVRGLRPQVYSFIRNAVAARGRKAPNLVIKIDFVPTPAKCLAAPRCGQDAKLQRPRCIARIAWAIMVRGERYNEPKLLMAA